MALSEDRGGGSQTQPRHLQKRLILYVFGMCCGSTSFGYAAAIIATTLGQPSFQTYMKLDTNPNAPQIEGAMNSLFYAGGFFGSLFTSWFADRFGRKTAIATACGIMIVSSALCAGSVDVAMFMVFRFFTGWSCLMLLVSVPLWITEIAPPKGRGVLANIHGLMAVVGYLLASLVGLGFYYYQHGSGNQWRAPLAFACLFPLITLILMPILPESPRWLLANDQADKAWQIIGRLHHNLNDPDNNYALAEFTQMQKQLDLDRSMDSSWTILLTRPSYRKRVLISCALLSMIYSSGTLVISNYGPSLFAGLGYDTAQTLIFQVGIILVSCTALSLSLLFVDKIPRNTILAVGMVAVSIALALEAAMTAVFVGTSNKSGLAAGVAFLYIYIFVYGLFLDGPGYYYAIELFPTHLRAKGATCCIASFSLINIMWLQVAPIAFASIGWKFYLVFIACALVSAVVMFTTFPNTLNKPLEEVAALFGDSDLVAIYQSELSVGKDNGAVLIEDAEKAERYS